MSNGQQNGDTLHDTGIGWIIILAIMGVLLWLFWYFFDTEVRNLVRWIRYAEMWLIGLVAPDDFTFVHNGVKYSYDAMLERAANFPAEDLTFNHLSVFSSMTMHVLKIPLVALLGMGAIWCIFHGPGTGGRNRMGLEELIARQSTVFPVISPFVKFNPATLPPRPPGAPVPAELPLFAEALGPEEWLAYNSVAAPDGSIDQQSAYNAFRKQLGKPWRGIKGLDDYKIVLLAAFALKSARKRKDCDEMLGRIARCWSEKDSLNLSKDKSILRDAKGILANKKISGEILSQANRHAFETTAMLRALQYAREEGGVLAPAEFVWLRGHDRRLWYPLNNLGRQSFHMEALGAMSHFKAEKMTQRPIPVPKVEMAVETITTYMTSLRARPIPALDYTNSKKKGVKKAV